MPVPIFYRKTPEGSIATYNFIDLAEGTGVVQYYGAKVSGAYLLTTNQLYSDEITTSGTAITSSAYVQSNSVNFDLTFNKPQNIKGDVLVNHTLGCYTALDFTRKTFASYAVVKYDGTTSTTLASGNSSVYDLTSLGLTGTGSKEMLTKLNIPTVQHFKKGHTLRIHVEQWGVSNGSNGVIFGYGHDPQGRADPTPSEKTVSGAQTTKLSVYVPFVIDL